MTAEQPDPPDPFTEVLIRRNVHLPDGTRNGIEAAFSLPAGPVSGDLLHALADIVERLDRAQAEGIADSHGDAAGMEFLDRVTEATRRWTE